MFGLSITSGALCDPVLQYIEHRASCDRVLANQAMLSWCNSEDRLVVVRRGIRVPRGWRIWRR